MAATTSKGVRLTPRELERVHRLRAFYPEAASESDLLKLATVRGLMLMEAEVTASGGGLPAGMTEDDLAAVILPRILVAVTWLARLGRLPLLVASANARAITSSNAVTTDSIGEHDQLETMDLTAADDIGGLGGDFLGDWPE